MASSGLWQSAQCLAAGLLQREYKRTPFKLQWLAKGSTGPAAGSVHLDTQRTTFKLSGLAESSMSCRGLCQQLKALRASFELIGLAEGSAKALNGLAAGSGALTVVNTEWLNAAGVISSRGRCSGSDL